MASFNPSALSLLFLCIQTLFFISQAVVPASSTFKFVNEVELEDYLVEYDGNYRPLSVFNSPFQLCFYNTTPNAYTLALRMSLRVPNSFPRWVWEANRGNPVRENATLTFGIDGNLVLVDADSRVAWQTKTANKGVVGFKLLPNGNMVLHDSKGNYVWQSFDYPTDTFLAGQSLQAGVATKLVSRASATNNFDGPYSFVLEPKGWGLYYQSNNSPRPMPYFSSSQWLKIANGNSIQNVTLTCDTIPAEGYASQVTLGYGVANNQFVWHHILARPNYNSTLTFIRLGIDGNLRFYTYNDNVSWRVWENTYTLFSGDSDVRECQLPDKCGKFGLFENNQCVACPRGTASVWGISITRTPQGVG